MDLNTTELNSFDTPLKRVFGKIFKTYENNVLHWCMFYNDFLPAKFEIIYRRFKMLSKLRFTDNSCLQTILNNIVHGDLTKMKSDFDLGNCESFHAVKIKLTGMVIQNLE